MVDTDVRHEGLSTGDFERLRRMVYTEAGINLSNEKKTMLEIRLRRRLRSLQIPTCADYCRYLFSPANRDKELVHFIDAVTTNKTDFFREPEHFDFLVGNALPELAKRLGQNRRALLWSAGCSTGEEPYTLAMVLSEYAREHPGYRFSILATDISTEVLGKAAKGIYKADAIGPIAESYRKSYLLRSRDPKSDLVRVTPELRSRVEFRRLNFMEPEFGIADAPEVIFCRNVIIYFDRQTQMRLLEKLVRLLVPGGYFFAGHSESLQNMDLPLTMAGPAVYRKTG